MLHAALVYTLFFCASVTVRTIRSAEALKSFQQQRGWNEKEAQREEGHNSIWTCLSLSESLHSFLSAAQERERDAAAAEGRDAATRRIQAESGSALLPVPHAPLDTRRPTLLYRPETGYIYKKNNKITFGGFFDGAGRRGETFNQDEWNRPREHLSVGNEVTQDISPSNSFSFSCNGAVPESREMPTAFYINQKRKIGRTGQS